MSATPLTAPQLVAAARGRIEEISPVEVERRMAAGAVLLDVREPAEFAAAHLAGATNIPRGLLEFRIETHPAMAGGTSPELALHDRPIVVYCRGGGRAALAAQSLQAMGFKAVASLTGGIQGWQASGRPTVTES